MCLSEFLLDSLVSFLTDKHIGRCKSRVESRIFFKWGGTLGTKNQWGGAHRKSENSIRIKYRAENRLRRHWAWFSDSCAVPCALIQLVLHEKWHCTTAWNCFALNNCFAWTGKHNFVLRRRGLWSSRVSPPVWKMWYCDSTLRGRWINQSINNIVFFRLEQYFLHMLNVCSAFLCVWCSYGVN